MKNQNITASSISEETKSQFEILLKRTLENQSNYKKLSKSFQKNDTHPNDNNDEENIKKPPVPLPRFKKSQSSISDENIDQKINLKHHTKLKIDSDDSSESSFHSSGTYNISSKSNRNLNKKSPLENEMDKILHIKRGSSSSSTNSNKYADQSNVIEHLSTKIPELKRHIRHKRKIQRDNKIEIDTETYSELSDNNKSTEQLLNKTDDSDPVVTSEFDGYVTIDIDNDKETESSVSSRRSLNNKLVRSQQKTIDDHDLVTEFINNQQSSNIEQMQTNNIVMVSSKNEIDDLIDNKSHVSLMSDDDEDLIVVSSTTNQIVQQQSHVEISAQNNSNVSIKSERKKWNKSDTIIFMPSQISTTEKYKKQSLSEITYDSYEEDIEPSEISSTLDSSSKQNTMLLINKEQFKSATIGDVIVHSSPSNSSSASIPVIEKSITNDQVVELSSSESDKKNHYANTNDDDEDVYVVKDPRQKPENLNTSSSSSYATDNDDENTKSETKSELSSQHTNRENDSNSIKSKESITENSEQSGRSTRSSNSNSLETNRVYKYEHIIGITIHKMDNIRRNSLTKHPLVKVYVIDMETGNYLKKSDAKRSVSYYYENQTIDYMTPVMTHEFNFIEKHTLYPQWEETLILNEDFEYLINNDKKIIFFEILDFVNFSLASSRYKKSGVNGGWYKIAWAFLKPVGKNGFLNVEKQIRLQLYKPSTKSSCDIYEFWLKKKYEKYPATLYVTVKRIIPNINVRKVLRSQHPIESEYETQSFDSSLATIDDKNSDNKSKMHDEINKKINLNSLNDEYLDKKWSRLTTQSCKVPNKLLYKLKMAGKGSFVVKFSNKGYLLACTTTDTNMKLFGIAIFKVITGEQYHTMSGHNGIIYALNWSENDRYLLSASADCTVYIWDINNKYKLPIHMLPHPAYVYSAIFYPININDNQLIIVTGCYDNVIRIWTENRIKKPQKLSFDLYDELENHNGYITSLCFDTNGANLYSADSIGVIIKWNVNDINYTFDREYKIRELRNQIINCVICHPGNQRLFIYGRDGILRMIDIATGCVMQWFKSTPFHVQTWCCLSPCGSLIFTSNTNCTVNVWNADTGHHEATFNLNEIFLTDSFLIHCIDYHPKEHMIAMCHYGHYSPVLVFCYDYDTTMSDNNTQSRIVYIVEKIRKTIITDESNNDAKTMMKVNEKENDSNKFRDVVHKSTLKNRHKPTLKNVIDRMDEIIQPLKINKIID